MAQNDRTDNRVYKIYDTEYFIAHGHGRDRPILGLGSGDSALYLDVLPSELASSAFETMDNEVDWNIMNHKGSQVPRLIAIQGDIDSNGAQPLYRHPADEQPSLVHWTPLAATCRDIVSDTIGQRLNHALIQKYRNGRDNIGEHADKTLDIDKGSMIVNLSLGASRVLILKSKADYSPPGDSTSRIYHKITLPHNSVFVLGWQSNRDFLHSIRQDKRMASLKTPEELAYDEQRISLTYRLVSTYILPNGRIYGQGGKCKTLEMVVSTNYNTFSQGTSGLNGDSVSHTCEDQYRSEVEQENSEDSSELAQSHKLLHAFSAENKTSTFDWDEHYGCGFDIVNFSFMNNYTRDK